ncbi:MAG: response regulator transcription factor [Clostridiales bacterium]|nr:response regulator transcription factor [Clostridiales bacterium]
MEHADRILVVEDEPGITGFLSTILGNNGYEVEKAANGKEALMMISSRCPDAVILDLGLPDMDGQRVISSVREWSGVPILVVSARTHERDKIGAFDLGADDYITKPFSTGELLARVKTALRHAKARESAAQSAPVARFQLGALTVDYDRHRVLLDGADVHLTQIEYKIVSLLSRNAGRVMTYDSMMKQVWGPTIAQDHQVLRVNMANIRRKLEQNPAAPKYIRTEIGVGYWMPEEE